MAATISETSSGNNSVLVTGSDAGLGPTFTAPTATSETEICHTINLCYPEQPCATDSVSTTDAACTTQPVCASGLVCPPNDSGDECRTVEICFANRTNCHNTTICPTGLPSLSSGGSAGAIAGAALGSIVGGLVIGAIITRFFFKYRGRKLASSSRDLEPDHGETAGDTYESIRVKNSAAPSSINGSNVQLDQYLLDGGSDETIANELQSLGQLIYQHVENHYHWSEVQISPAEASAKLQTLGFKATSCHDHNPDFIAKMAINPSTRETALRHTISTIVFRSIDVQSHSRFSMLPAPVTMFLQSMPLVNRSSNFKAATIAALSSWRRLSAFLLHPNPAERNSLPLAEDVIADQALELAEALGTFLNLFASPSKVGLHAQRENLQDVITECAKFGYVLFSHPSDWRLVYVSQDSNAQNAVVCAGLEKIRGKVGAPYEVPRTLVAPVLAPVVDLSSEQP